MTAYDSVGQQFNGYQIHKTLRVLGHSSHMFVDKSSMDELEIHKVGNSMLKLIDAFLVRIERMFSLQSVLPVPSLSMYSTSYYKNADVVHLQLLHAEHFCSLLNIPFLAKRKRVVWTIHDPWLMTGHCVYPLDCERWLTGCGNCPDLSLPLPIKRDATAFNWKLKKWIMHHSKVSLIVASQWMYDRVKQSPILSHLPCHLIPFGVDTKVFKPHTKSECRSRFGIPIDANVLAFRWTPNHAVKGSSYIKKALESLELMKPTYLLCLDAPYAYGIDDALMERYNFIFLGWVDDRDLLISVLNAADIFLMPSTAEAFGLMAVESMACGTPVIVFEGTSLPSVIHAPHGGIAVPYKDHEALATAIRELLDNQDLYQSLVKNGLEIVRQEYSLELYIKRHLDLYDTLLS